MTTDFSQPESPTVDAIVEAAVAKADLDLSSQPAQPSWRAGLELVSAALQRDTVSNFGRGILAGEAVNYLANRLRVDDWHQTHPDLADAPIEQPLVILGLPRTGTTLLSYLLDADPQWRSLLNWEAIESVPPATTATLRSDPRGRAKLEFQEAVFPIIDPPPPHWEWAFGPTECTFLLAGDFKAVMWEARLADPAYQDFISSCDMTSAYAYHRRALQVLQSEAPGNWVLKMPAHAWFIESLLRAYPDARIIWSHRDPTVAVASFLDLMGFSHGISFGQANPDWIRATYPPRLAEYIHRAEAALAGRDVHHVHYADVMANPIGEIRRLYEWTGADLSPTVERAMTDWVAADPIRRPRKRAYSLADWDLTADDLDPEFGHYAERYGIASESLGPRG